MAFRPSRDHGLDGHNSPARIRANSAAAVAGTVTTASMVIISWLVGVMVGCSAGCEMRRMEDGGGSTLGLPRTASEQPVTPVERFSLQHKMPAAAVRLPGLSTKGAAPQPAARSATCRPIPSAQSRIWSQFR